MTMGASQGSKKQQIQCMPPISQVRDRVGSLFRGSEDQMRITDTNLVRARTLFRTSKTSTVRSR